MPARFQTSSAAPEDDAALRDILRRTPLPGAIPVTLEREPSFFGGDVDTLCHEVAVGRDAQLCAAGEVGIVGMGSRIERQAWLHGKPATVAYLGDLRVLPEHRKFAGRILLSGFEHLGKLNTVRPVAATYTAIFEDNAPALRVLVGGRAGLPRYVDCGRLLCPAIVVSGRSPKPALRLGIIRSATEADMPDLVRFLNDRFSHRDLAPVHSEEDFRAGHRWPGLQISDFLIALEGERIAGAVAVWDLRKFRQIRVQNYSGWLGRIRPIISLGMKCIGWPALPVPGEILPAAFASFLSVEEDNIPLARSLVAHARHKAYSRGVSLLFTCLHEHDPLAPVLKGWPAIPASGRLFQVVFPSDSQVCIGRLPHVEAALL